MAKISSFLTTQGKGLSLLFTMLIGALVPQAHVFSFLIQYLLMVMLFFAFLDIEFKPQTFQKSVLWVLFANIAVAFISYAALVSVDITLALAAFMTAIAPTAIAAPVIIGFIERDVEYVVTAVILTNIASALIVPIDIAVIARHRSSNFRLGSFATCADRHVRAVDPLAACFAACLQTRKNSFAREKHFLSPSGWSTFSSSAPTHRIFFATEILILFQRLQLLQWFHSSFASSTLAWVRCSAVAVTGRKPASRLGKRIFPSSFGSR